MSASDNSPAMITLEGVMALQKERDDLRRRLDALVEEVNRAAVQARLDNDGDDRIRSGRTDRT